MAKFLFLGGSQDGLQAEVKPPTHVGTEVRMPPTAGKRLVEVYALRDDGRFHFVRYGVPTLHLTDPEADQQLMREVKDVCVKLAPLVAELEAILAARGGYMPVDVDQWTLTRRDE